MFQAGSHLTNVLPLYTLALTLLLGLMFEAFKKRKTRPWSIPALAVYATVGIWYYVELFYTPERFQQFSFEIIEASYIQVILFLITFRLFLPGITRRCLKNYHAIWRFAGAFNPRRLLIFVGFLWLCLLAYGAYRLNGDILNALFPVASRAGRHMWGRAAAGGAGSSGFIVSSAGYTYTLVTAFLVTLLPLPMGRQRKFLNIVLVCLALPYFVFLGDRNKLLAVVMPGYFSYALFSPDKVWRKILFSAAIFLILNHVLTLIISLRNVGFSDLFSGGGITFTEALSSQKHRGLNMLEELCYINRFYEQGQLTLSYGGRYLAELANVIPRAVWPNKPLIGIEYAVLRGFGGASNDIGVFATVSTGLLGQGFYNFGPIFGPMASGTLMAIWAGWLSRLWMQQYSVLRLCLFLVSLGLTFNLGREISLLVLWPVLFGYGIVRFLENSQKKRIRRGLGSVPNSA